MKIKKAANLNNYLFVARLRTDVRFLKYIILKYILIIFSLLNMPILIYKYWPYTTKLYKLYKNKYFHKHHDNQLEKIATKFSQRLSLDIPSYFSDTKNILYLASNIVDIGGHTRVMYDFIKNHNKERFSIFTYITEIDAYHNSRETRYYNYLNTLSKDIYISQIPQKEYTDKVSELINYISSNKINTIVLFEHAWDLVTLAAIVRVKLVYNIKVIYYHHHNLHLTVFPNIMDAYIEISDGTLPEVHKTYPTAEFMEIPIEIDTPHQPNYDSTEKYIFLTAIPFHKMFVNNTKTFPRFVVKLLQANKNSKYLIVTYRNEKWIKSLEKYFADNGVWGRIDIKDSINDLSTLNNEFDIYIDGLPIGGGKTILEMMALKKPSIILEDKRSLFTQSSNLNFIKAYSFEELNTRISKLRNNSEFQKQYIEKSATILKYHFNPKDITIQLETIIKKINN